jgi:hypothetical protein
MNYLSNFLTMKTYSDLTGKVLTYQNCERKNSREAEMQKRTILEQMFLFIYYFPVDRGIFEEELSSEFLLFIFPKISRLIMQFRYQGISFEQYLRKIITWQLKSFLNKKFQQEKNENIYYHYYISEQENSAFNVLNKFDSPEFTFDPEPLYTASQKALIADIQKNKLLRKKMLIVTLTFSNQLSLKAFIKAAQLFNIEPDVFAKWAAELQDSIKDRIDRIQRFEELRNSAFLSIMLLQNSLREITPGSRSYCSALNDISRLRLTVERANEDIRISRGKILYREISEILEIPCGSIGSSVHYGKKYLRKIGALDESR